MTAFMGNCVRRAFQAVKKRRPGSQEMFATAKTSTSRRSFMTTAALSSFAFLAKTAPAQPQNRRVSMEITIRENNSLVTLISVFTVEPTQQEKLMRLLKEGTETLFSKQPGFVAASFHKSLDGRRVVNYGQWRTIHDIEAFHTKPELGEYFKRVGALSQFETVICEVAYVDHA
jgi:quinol monooxygenase YgiN